MLYYDNWIALLVHFSTISNVILICKILSKKTKYGVGYILLLHLSGMWNFVRRFWFPLASWWSFISSQSQIWYMTLMHTYTTLSLYIWEKNSKMERFQWTLGSFKICILDTLFLWSHSLQYLLLCFVNSAMQYVTNMKNQNLSIVSSEILGLLMVGCGAFHWCFYQ